MTPLTDRIGLRVAGEADLATVSAFEVALAELGRRAASKSGCADVVLEVGGLSFVSVRALEVIVALCDALPTGHLVLEHPTAQLTRILAMLWPATEWKTR